MLVSISSHGFGHLSQTAPVLNALHHIRPDIEFVIRSTLDPDRIRSRLRMPVDILVESDDVGMLMKDAVNVDLQASLDALIHMHQDWQAKVKAYALWLRQARIDVVLSNVAYLPLAAASLASLPCVGMSSLRWDAILEPLLDPASLGTRQSVAQSILQEMRRAYEGATRFLCMSPCMTLPASPNLQPIGPVSDPGSRREDELKRKLAQLADVPEDCYLILVGMGGMPFEFSLKAWPLNMHGRKVFYLTEARFAKSHPHAISIDPVGMSYSNLIASVDLVMTKPGYGTFVEAAMVGTPVLYVERPNWAETEALVSWLGNTGTCQSMTRTALDDGSAARAAEQLLRQARRLRMTPHGNQEAAEILSRLTC